MVGIPVTIEYDEAWDGLTKNLICRCSPWGSNDGEIRTLLNVGEASIVAHEVMQPDMYLYLGVEGFRSDGTVVIPTTWARCGKIEYGANTCEDPSTDPELPIWNQLQTEVEQIKRDGYTQEQIDEIQVYVQSASRSAASAAKSESNAAAASNVAVSNANLAELYAKQAQESAEAARTSAGSAANLANGALQAQRAAEAAAQRAEVAAGSGENLTGTDVSSIKTILGNIMTIIKAQVEDENGTPQGYNIVVSGLFAQNDALISALGGSGDSGETPEKILVSISATYSGEPVPAGTAPDELVGVVVTARYGDGSTADVTDYTLSGVIAEGSNTIVAGYGGMTATFEVVGTGSTVYLADIAQFDQFIIRKALTQNSEAGAWSVEVPYTEGMTVSGCIQPSWKNSYGIAVITAPDDTQSTSFDYDTEGVRLVDGGTPVQQYTAVLAGFTEGSTVRINMFMGPSVTTEELARAFAATHKDYLYYEPGEV